MIMMKSLFLVLCLLPSSALAFGIPKEVQKAFVGAVTAFTLSTSILAPANAAESKMLGQIAGSGLVFKDTLTVESFNDPKVCSIIIIMMNLLMMILFDDALMNLCVFSVTTTTTPNSHYIHIILCYYYYYIIRSKA